MCTSSPQTSHRGLDSALNAHPHPSVQETPLTLKQKPRWVKLTKEPLFQSQHAAAQLPLFQGELRLCARRETNFWYHLSPRLAGFCGLWFCSEDVCDVSFKFRGTWLSCNLLIGVPVQFLSKRQKIFVLTVKVMKGTVLSFHHIHFFLSFCEKLLGLRYIPPRRCLPSI